MIFESGWRILILVRPVKRGGPVVMFVEEPVAEMGARGWMGFVFPETELLLLVFEFPVPKEPCFSLSARAFRSALSFSISANILAF
jgi:hypothetical protein